MAQTTVFRLPITAPKPTRYFIGPKMGGFPSYLMTNQFRFADADVLQGAIDDVTGNRFALVKGDAATDKGIIAPGGVVGGVVAAAGGLRLTGKASIAGPLVNVVDPFTMILAVTLATPDPNKSMEMMSFGEFPQRGMTAWMVAAGSIPSDKGHAAAAWQSDRGNVGADALAYIQTPVPYVAKYGELEVLMLIHKGNGLIRLEQRKGGNVTFVEKQLNNIYWQGPTNDRQTYQRWRIGTFATAFLNTTGCTVECASFYQRDLSVISSEVQQWIDGAYALAALRGRA